MKHRQFFRCVGMLGSPPRGVAPPPVKMDFFPKSCSFGHKRMKMEVFLWYQLYSGSPGVNFWRAAKPMNPEFVFFFTSVLLEHEFVWFCRCWDRGGGKPDRRRPLGCFSGFCSGTDSWSRHWTVVRKTLSQRPRQVQGIDSLAPKMQRFFRLYIAGKKEKALWLNLTANVLCSSRMKRKRTWTKMDTPITRRINSSSRKLGWEKHIARYGGRQFRFGNNHTMFRIRSASPSQKRDSLWMSQSLAALCNAPLDRPTDLSPLGWALKSCYFKPVKSLICSKKNV